MTTAWAHLPNAKYIDLVLASLKSHPTKWTVARGAACGAAWDAARDAVRNAAWDAVRDAAWDAARDAVRDAAWDAARDAVRNAAWDAVRDAAWNAAWNAARGAAWNAILALIAYDDCAHLLYSDPEEVELLAKLGVPAAILLLPACIALNKTKG